MRCYTVGATTAGVTATGADDSNTPRTQWHAAVAATEQPNTLQHPRNRGHTSFKTVVAGARRVPVSAVGLPSYLNPNGHQVEHAGDDPQGQGSGRLVT